VEKKVFDWVDGSNLGWLTSSVSSNVTSDGLDIAGWVIDYKERVGSVGWVPVNESSSIDNAGLQVFELNLELICRSTPQVETSCQCHQNTYLRRTVVDWSELVDDVERFLGASSQVSGEVHPVTSAVSVKKGIDRTDVVGSVECARREEVMLVTNEHPYQRD